MPFDDPAIMSAQLSNTGEPQLPPPPAAPGMNLFNDPHPVLNQQQQQQHQHQQLLLHHLQQQQQRPMPFGPFTGPGAAWQDPAIISSSGSHNGDVGHMGGANGMGGVGMNQPLLPQQAQHQQPNVLDFAHNASHFGQDNVISVNDNADKQRIQSTTRRLRVFEEVAGKHHPSMPAYANS
jgi:hypothetical protein